MKTAISIPDSTFQAAEQFAITNQLSRSELYTRALREYLQRHEQISLTARINAVCEEVSTKPDAFITHLAVSILEPSEDWS